MTKRWNTLRIALWGLFLGPLYSFAKAYFDGTLPRVWDADGLAYILGGLIGGALGGAALFALVSGVRNLILRAK